MNGGREIHETKQNPELADLCATLNSKATITRLETEFRPVINAKNGAWLQRIPDCVASSLVMRSVATLPQFVQWSMGNPGILVSWMQFHIPRSMGLLATTSHGNYLLTKFPDGVIRRPLWREDHFFPSRLVNWQPCRRRIPCYQVLVEQNAWSTERTKE